MSKSFKPIKRRPQGFGRGINRIKKPHSFLFQTTNFANAVKGYRFEKEYEGNGRYDEAL
jgi:hypothetical protein